MGMFCIRTLKTASWRRLKVGCNTAAMSTGIIQDSPANDI